MQRMWDSITEETITMAQEKIQDFKKEEIDMMIAESITTGVIVSLQTVIQMESDNTARKAKNCSLRKRK